MNACNESPTLKNELVDTVPSETVVSLLAIPSMKLVMVLFFRQTAT